MPDYQIILLPRVNYWDWVRACRDYMLVHAPNLTADPDTAGRYMAPGQIVTIVLAPGAYPVQGDIEAFFQTRYPEARLDIIEVSTPDDLKQKLQERVQTDSRYGTQAQPFRLVWPTDYAFITQAFGAHPEIYRRFGLPGHEGLDIRAPNNANVYAMADGMVYEIHDDPQNHNYGRHIRIRHADGYRTVYAHLAKVLVQQGQQVQAGEKIALADSTGNSTGSHLHITLKKEGATASGLTRYPSDILDPTHYMVWPHQKAEELQRLYDWPANTCLVGVNARSDGAFTKADFDAIKKSRVEAINFPQYTSSADIDRLLKIDRDLFILCSLRVDMTGGPVSSQDFIGAVREDFSRLYQKGVRYFQIAHEPNLRQGGWGVSWKSGSDFTIWFLEVINGLHQQLPQARLGFPALSSGDQVEGQRQNWLVFMEQADPALMASDWIGISAYWTSSAEMNSPDRGHIHETLRLRYPGHLLMLSEVAVLDQGQDSASAAQAYLTYLKDLRARPGYAAGFVDVLSSPTGSENLVWRAEDGRITGIPDAFGRRSF